jgi:hypothetical protein
MKCYLHPEKNTAGMCVGCGKPICEECLVEVERKNYCKSCAAEELGLFIKEGKKEYRLRRYWEKQFERFSQQGFKISWNWAAFFLGPLWYLFKGMWLKAVGLCFVVPFASAMALWNPDAIYVILLIWVYAGCFGNWDLFLYREKELVAKKHYPKHARYIYHIVLSVFLVAALILSIAGSEPEYAENLPVFVEGLKPKLTVTDNEAVDILEAQIKVEEGPRLKPVILYISGQAKALKYLWYANILFECDKGLKDKKPLFGTMNYELFPGEEFTFSAKAALHKLPSSCWVAKIRFEEKPPPAKGSLIMAKGDAVRKVVDQVLKRWELKPLKQLIWSDEDIGLFLTFNTKEDLIEIEWDSIASRIDIARSRSIALSVFSAVGEIFNIKPVVLLSTIHDTCKQASKNIKPISQDRSFGFEERNLREGEINVYIYCEEAYDPIGKSHLMEIIISKAG